jgi:hypothetical protein
MGSCLGSNGKELIPEINIGFNSYEEQRLTNALIFIHEPD